MRALEFKSKIKNNRIFVPTNIQSELKGGSDQDVRVIVFVEDSDKGEDVEIRKVEQSQFLKGYAETDSIYDNY